jgi:hypothetical protein
MKKVFLVLVGMLMLGACAGMPTTALQVEERATIVDNQNSRTFEFPKINLSKMKRPKRVQNVMLYFISATVSKNKATKYILTYTINGGNRPIELAKITDTDGVTFNNELLDERQSSAYSRAVSGLNFFSSDFAVEIPESYINDHINGIDFIIVMQNTNKISFDIPTYYIHGVLDTVKKAKKAQE